MVANFWKASWATKSPIKTETAVSKPSYREMKLKVSPAAFYFMFLHYGVEIDEVKVTCFVECNAVMIPHMPWSLLLQLGRYYYIGDITGFVIFTFAIWQSVGYTLSQQCRACIAVLFGFGFPLPGLPADFTTDLLVRLWSGGNCTHSGTHPLASNNQFLPDEGDFRGCGFISARLETSGTGSKLNYDSHLASWEPEPNRNSPNLLVCLNG